MLPCEYLCLGTLPHLSRLIRKDGKAAEIRRSQDAHRIARVNLKMGDHLRQGAEIGRVPIGAIRTIENGP